MVQKLRAQAETASFKLFEPGPNGFVLLAASSSLARAGLRVSRFWRLLEVRFRAGLSLRAVMQLIGAPRRRPTAVGPSKEKPHSRAIFAARL